MKALVGILSLSFFSLGPVALADLTVLQPVMQTLTCKGELNGNTYNVIVTDVLLNGFRGFRNRDGTPADIIATVLGIQIDFSGGWAQAKTVVKNPYAQKADKTQVYSASQMELTVNLPGIEAGDEFVYRGTFKTNIPVDLTHPPSLDNWTELDVDCQARHNL